MDAITFIKEHKRMCKSQEDCDSCKLGENRYCNYGPATPMSTEEIKEVVRIVEEWSKTHPLKTMIQDFFEKFPNAPKDLNGTPQVCPYQCGYTKEEYCMSDGEMEECIKCWSRPVEGDET